MVVLKWVGFAVACYAAIRFAGVCFEWIRIGIDCLRPDRLNRKHRGWED